MTRPKMPQQGSTIPINSKEVWDEFLVNAKWDVADVDAEKALLTEQREKVLDQVAVLDAKRKVLDDQIATLGHRETLAKKHLDELTKRLGGFATRKVLLASLQERFPPAAVLKTGVKPKHTADTWEASEAQTQAIMDHLDCEGMTSYQLQKKLSGSPAEELTSKQIAAVLKRQIRKGHVRREGERRSTEYSLVPTGGTAEGGTDQ